jgi:hypothetical protein
VSRYYVNDHAQPTGEHEVHKQGCSYMPGDRHRQFVGNFDSCQPAVQAAATHYANVDGCYFCCRACHTR